MVQASGRDDAERLRSVLEGAGLRATAQRLALLRVLLREGDRHVTAQELHQEAARAGLAMSMATVYNGLNQMRDAGLLGEVFVDAGRVWFDTRTDPHAHLFDADAGTLRDVELPAGMVGPELAPDQELVGLGLVYRVRRRLGSNRGGQSRTTTPSASIMNKG